MARGMKLFSNACSLYDHVFPSMTIIVTYAIMDNAHYTIFGWVKSIMTTSINLKVVYNDKNMNSQLIMVGKNVGNLFLYICFTFQNNSCKSTPKSIVGCSVFILAQTLKHIDT